MAFHELSLADRMHITQRGTDLFAQRFAELPNEALNGDTLLTGWTRKHLVAHIAFNAAALCRLLDWAATGVETPMYRSSEHRNREIAEGALLDAEELRRLFADNIAQLGEKWSQLPVQAWHVPVRTAQGRTVAASETLWMRSREVWIHAVDLDTGASFTEIPAVVLEGLLDDIVDFWRRKDVGTDVAIEVVGRPRVVVRAGQTAPRVARGSLPAVVRWAAGRGAIGLTCDNGLPAAPPWL